VIHGLPIENHVRVVFTSGGILLDDATKLIFQVEMPSGQKMDSRTTAAAGLRMQLRNQVNRWRTQAEWEIEHAAALVKDVAELKQFIEAPFPQEADLRAEQRKLSEIEAQMDAGVQRETPRGVTDATAQAGERANLEDDESVQGILPRAIRRFLGADTVRTPEGVPEVRSEDPAVERRFQDARLEQKTMWEKLGDSLRRLQLSFARSFPHLEPKTHGQAIEALRQYRQTREFSQLSALSVIRGFTADFGPKRYDVFRRHVVLSDLLGDVEAGRHNAAELPFGYKDVETLRRDFERVRAFVDANPEIAAALQARKKFFKSLRQRLVDLDRLPDSVLEREDYFHRQILQYVQMERAFPGATGVDVRAKKKGFERKREGSSLDYNTEYLEAEFKVISDAIAQINTVETLIRIDKAYNIQKTLKQAARKANEKKLYELWAAAGNDPLLDDPLRPFKQRLAMAFGELRDLAAREELPVGVRYRNLLDDLADGAMVSDPLLWDMLQELLEIGEEGARAAGVIFKTIRQRHDFIKRSLGPEFKTWHDLVPEGYTVWQPEPGNAFYWTNSISDKILDEVLSGERKMTPAETNRVLAVGGRKPEWVIPEGIALTLSDFKQSRQESWIEQASASLLGKWKQWILLNPFSVTKYNLNNLSGDADIVNAYNPRIFKQVPKAAKDLARFHRRDKAADVEFLELVRRGVLGSGFAGEEVPNVRLNEVFDQLFGRKPQIHKKYWRTVRGFTQWREDVLRLAAYRHFLGELQAGRRNIFGASNPEKVNQVKDIRDRAALLARELIGDYGNISEAGRWIRRHMIPFWSWMEINAPRYYKMFRNTQFEGNEEAAGRMARAAGWTLGKRVSALALRALILVGMVSLWNRIMFPNEDRQMNRQKQPLRLILGRDDDGNIRSIRVQGALSDATGWFGFDNPIRDVEALATGERAPVDQLAELYKAPVNRVVNGALPVQKSVLESLVGMKTFPDMWNPRPVRDSAEHLAGSIGMQRLYRVLAGKPNRGVWKELTDVMAYTNDTGELAYYTARGMAGEWLDKHRPGETSRTIPSERANALHYHRLAVRYNDMKKADEYLTKYFDLGGTPVGLYQSIARARPLEMLRGDEKDPFLESLSDEERAIVQQAEEWYDATYIDQEDAAYNVDRVMALWRQYEAEQEE
jgi:hypothetical protein